MDTHLRPTSRSRLFWTLFVVVAIWKILAAMHLDVCYDEGYYHFWSLYPQLSYLDHPPLAAWAMYLASYIFGDSVWTVRIWPLVTGTILVLVGRALATRMFGGATGTASNETVGNLAGLFLLLAPVFVGNGILMTPDTLFALCWALALYCSWRALESPAVYSHWWLLAGLSAGFGFLSKYVMVLFFLGLGLLWILAPSYRKRIFVGGLICGLIAFVMFLPVILWNAQNHWISFAFQLKHGFSGKPSSVIKHFSTYVGSLLLLATPLLGGLALWSSFRGLGRKEFRIQFLASFCAATVGFFAFSALKSHVEANWPMVAFFSGLILVAHDWTGYPLRLRQAAAGVLAACCVFIGAYVLLPAQFPLAIGGRSLDVGRIREFIGGPELAAEVQAAKDERDLDFVYVPSHQMLGRLSFYAPKLRPALCPSYNTRIRYPWIDCSQWTGRKALIVTESQGDPKTALFDPRLGVNFHGVEFLRTVKIPYKKYREQKVNLFIGTDYSPEPLFPPPAKP